MSGTVSGGLKAREANLKKNPNHYKDIGRIGGRRGTGHAFAHGKFSPADAGTIGGKISKRTGIKGGAGKSRSVLRNRTFDWPKPKFWEIRYKRQLKRLRTK